MSSETLSISENDSAISDSGLILSVRQALGQRCSLVVGYPGLPNATSEAQTGDALLYETPDAGTFEVRVLSQGSWGATLLLTHVSPRPGLLAGFASSDPNNTPFTESEIEDIAASINRVKDELRNQGTLLPEQMDLIGRKLDEIQEASSRLGRKDWINYTIGTITAICVSAAFSSAATKSIFVALDAAFSWLFGNALQLLP